jgi:signal transduction histidine kinase/ActR/RegA family two-component response regulator
LITRDGSRRPVAESGAPLHNHEGATIGAVLAFRDVSMEHALQGRLQRSQQLEALGRLAGGVAHDFNNLLTVIGGSASLALEDMEETHPARDELSYVLEATKRAVGMTSQLLAFSRRQVMQPQAVDLNASITQTCQMMRRLLREHVHIALELGSDVGHVMVDPVQLEQVIMNLALNAGDAMPQGGVLRLSTARVVVDDEHPVPSLKPQAYVRFRVADTGVGMNEDTQRHAFEPFFTTKQRSRGTGLGLATVYGIVQQSGGTVTLHSVPQEGTTFDIYLPWAEAPQQGGQAFPASEPIGVADAGRTILVVEDDPMVRWLVVSTLTKAGHRVLEAESGEEAIARLEAGSLGRLDLLVTDVVMQATSGVQVAERLVTTYAKVPVLFMSGYANEVLASQGLRKAGNAFLAKPFTPAQLLKAANRLLKERRNTAARSSGAA